MSKSQLYLRLTSKEKSMTVWSSQISAYPRIEVRVTHPAFQLNVDCAPYQNLGCSFLSVVTGAVPTHRCAPQRVATWPKSAGQSGSFCLLPALLHQTLRAWSLPSTDTFCMWPQWVLVGSQDSWFPWQGNYSVVRKHPDKFHTRCQSVFLEEEVWMEVLYSD